MEDVHVGPAPPSAPVFVKGSGRRGVVFHWIGRLTGACAVLYLAILVLGFVGVSWVPPAHLPLAGSILPAPVAAPRLVDNAVEIQAPPRTGGPAPQVTPDTTDRPATTTQSNPPATTPAQRDKPAATATTAASTATSQTVTPPAAPAAPPSQSPRATSTSTAATTTSTSSPAAATTHTVPPTAVQPTHPSKP